MAPEMPLKLSALLLFAMAVAFAAVALLTFDPLISFLERHFSDDGHLKESTKLMLELKLYAHAAFGVGAGTFLLACSRRQFRHSVRDFLLYEPASPRAPSPGAVLRFLTTIVVVLLAMSLLGQYLLYVADLGGTRLTTFVYTYFNLDREHWVPTTFSAAILLYGGLLLANIAWRKHARGGEYVTHWALLSLAFVYLSGDEKFRVHEWLFNSLIPYLDVGLPVFWVVPAGILTLIGVLAYVGFLFHLPPAYRVLVVLAGAVYLGGAIGWEIVGQAYALEHGIENFRYEQLANTEEVFEMMGTVLFIYALQSYLQDLGTPDENLLQEAELDASPE